MTESTPIAVPGHAELRAQAVELRLHGLLAHWDELMGQPETEQRVLPSMCPIQPPSALWMA